ncbi:hypothetical protein HK405_016077, partial [Cladochytrium tenue]
LHNNSAEGEPVGVEPAPVVVPDTNDQPTESSATASAASTTSDGAHGTPSAAPCSPTHQQASSAAAASQPSPSASKLEDSYTQAARLILGRYAVLEGSTGGGGRGVRDDGLVVEWSVPGTDLAGPDRAALDRAALDVGPSAVISTGTQTDPITDEVLATDRLADLTHNSGAGNCGAQLGPPSRQGPDVPHAPAAPVTQNGGVSRSRAAALEAMASEAAAAAAAELEAARRDLATERARRRWLECQLGFAAATPAGDTGAGAGGADCADGSTGGWVHPAAAARAAARQQAEAASEAGQRLRAGIEKGLEDVVEGVRMLRELEARLQGLGGAFECD